jgi:hypothetical protein
MQFDTNEILPIKAPEVACLKAVVHQTNLMVRPRSQSTKLANDTVLAISKDLKSDPVSPPQQTDFLSCSQTDLHFSSNALAPSLPMGFLSHAQNNNMVYKTESRADLQLFTPLESLASTNSVANIESALKIENVNVASLVEYESWSDDDQPSRRRKCPKCVRYSL